MKYSISVPTSPQRKRASMDMDKKIEKLYLKRNASYYLTLPCPLYSTCGNVKYWALLPAAGVDKEEAGDGDDDDDGNGDDGDDDGGWWWWC